MRYRVKDGMINGTLKKSVHLWQINKQIKIMNPERHQQLLEKRAQLQLRIRFNEFVKECILSFIALLDELQHLEIAYRVVELRYSKAEFQPLLMALFETETYTRYGFSKHKIFIDDDDTPITKLIEKYPSRHSSRYFPNLPIIDVQVEDPKTVLQNAIKDYKLSQTLVYMCWILYPFLLEVPLDEVAHKATNELFNSWHEDVVIFPKDYSWVLVCHSFESEWLFGS